MAGNDITESSTDLSDDALAEAERRIKDVRDRGAFALQLSATSTPSLRFLKALPKSLGELGITTLGVFRLPVTNVDVVGQLDTLESLTISRTKASDFSTLGRLHRLRTLVISHSTIADLSFLRDLPNLLSLQLNQVETADWSALAQLRALRRLNLRRCNIKDTAPIAQLRQLTSLSCSFCPIQDLTPLAKLHGLENVSLVGTNVSDISAISTLPRLESLNLNRTRVRDLSPLAGSVSLVQAIERAEERFAAGKMTEQALERIGLRFNAANFRDSPLGAIGGQTNPSRTLNAFDYIRAQAGFSQSDSDDSGRPHALPAQSAKGPKFTHDRSGKIDLASSTSNSANERALRQSLTEKLEELARDCPPTSNTCGHLARPIASYITILRVPDSPPAAAWSAGNTLRRAFSADQRRRQLSENDRDTPPLPEGIAERLADLVETHNVWSALDADMIRLDALRPSPSEREQAESTLRTVGRSIAQAAVEAPDLFTAQARAAAMNAVEEASDASSDTSLAGAQAQAVAQATLENLVTETVTKTIEELGSSMGASKDADRTAEALEKLVSLAESPRDKAFAKGLAANMVAGSIGAAGTGLWFLIQNGAAITGLLASNPQLVGLLEIVRVLLRIFGALG